MEIKLQTSDMFKLLKITKKTGMFENIKGLFKNVQGKSKEELEKIQTEVGMDIIIGILSGLDNAENEIYQLVGGCTGKKAKEVEEQDPMITMEVIQEILKSEVFKSFLSFFSK
ncbi:hypothetical protein [Clostridium niameyense]|uniref:hypothetical protein n=1 Tax=Clostridium niameyense TaxID=1622073 RepID=UPI00067F0E25|nr:hypothetical protein [Clostridium niameyense]